MVVRCLVAIGAGALLAGGYPPVGVVWCVPIAVAVLVAVVRGLTPPAAILPGLCFGLAFELLTLSWVRAVAWDGWLVLAGAESLFFALLAVALSLVGRLPAGPVWSACCWLAVEVWRTHWPFGGLPWGRLGVTVADSVFAQGLPYLSINGTGLLLALTGCWLAWVAGPGRASPRLVVLTALPLLATVALPVLRPYAAPTDGAVTVAVVQSGVPGDGTDLLAHHRAVTAQLAIETVGLADDIQDGTAPRPRFVLWPENSTAIDPFTDDQARGEISLALHTIGAPILVGAMVDAPVAGQVLNQSIVMDPHTGAGDRYTKWHPVPFGEYIPWRDRVFPSNFGQLREIHRDMGAGSRQTPLDIDGISVAAAICFDVAYDDTIYTQVADGAQLVTVQTSNAMFTHTAQLDQQWDISRLRALETGRALLVASTTGVTGVVNPDGTVVERLSKLRPGVLTARVPLAVGHPSAVVVGPWIGWAAVVVAVMAGLVGAVTYRRGHTRGHEGEQ